MCCASVRAVLLWVSVTVTAIDWGARAELIGDVEIAMASIPCSSRDTPVATGMLPETSYLTTTRLRDFSLDTRDELLSDLCVLRSVDFAHAGWAGDIDFGEIVANDIEAYK